MITPSEAHAYRRRLVEWLERMDAARAQLKRETLQPTGGEASGGLSNRPLHPADLGSHSYEVDMGLDLIQNEEALIEEINAALRRLDEGTFGQCELCRQEISQDRLQALPYARWCVACARREEARGTM